MMGGRSNSLLVVAWSCLLAVSQSAFVPSSSSRTFTFAPITTTTRTSSTSSTSLYAVNGATAEKTTTNKKGQNGKTAVIAGATGYIGRSVVREAVRQGYQTYAIVRDAQDATSKFGGGDGEFQGATVIECDVCDANALTKQLRDISNESKGKKIDAIVSCLASRSGVKKDALKIDYQATLNCLESGCEVGARHFVLLSAFCVKNPWLQFQVAKLKFEDALQAQDKMTYTVVRPTAFFKSVSGQLEAIQAGAPFVMFGDGTVTQCNPIAESDLATYLMDSVTDKKRENKIINLGGPDEPLTMRKQGEMLFQAVSDANNGGDTTMQPKFINAPLWLFDTIINTLQFFADLTGSEGLEDAAETGRIGKYYAVESMLTTDPEEKFGTITLQEHYNRIAVEGQEYDPYTSMFAMSKEVTKAIPISNNGKVDGDDNGDSTMTTASTTSTEKREKVESSSS